MHVYVHASMWVWLRKELKRLYQEGVNMAFLRPLPEYKIILLGEQGVGKTTFFKRVRDHEFTASTLSTGCDSLTHTMRIGNTEVKVRITFLGSLQCP